MNVKKQENIFFKQTWINKLNTKRPEDHDSVFFVFFCAKEIILLQKGKIFTLISTIVYTQTDPEKIT